MFIISIFVGAFNMFLAHWLDFLLLIPISIFLGCVFTSIHNFFS
jgi:hypothetical protein